MHQQGRRFNRLVLTLEVEKLGGFLKIVLFLYGDALMVCVLTFYFKH